MNCKDYALKLADILKDADCEGHVSLAFSGGLDSSIIAFIIKKCEPSLYTVGFKNSPDIRNSIEAARDLKLEIEKIIIDEYKLLEAIKKLKNLAPELNPVELAFELPLMLVCEDAKHGFLYTGQGADELFGGYAKYMENPELMPGDLEKVLTRMSHIERRIASYHGLKLITPYLNPDIVKLSSEIPINCKIKDGVRKYVLREAGRILGVPESIIMREKKAAQYGSGIWRNIRKLAKREGKSVSEFLQEI